MGFFSIFGDIAGYTSANAKILTNKKLMFGTILSGIWFIVLGIVLNFIPGINILVRLPFIGKFFTGMIVGCVIMSYAIKIYRDIENEKSK